MDQEKYIRKYEKRFGKYKEENESNIKRVLFLLREKKGFYQYKYEDLSNDLIEYCKLDSEIVPDWHKKLFRSELKRREKEEEEVKKIFATLNTKEELASILGINYGKLVYFLYKTNKYKTFQIRKKKPGEYRTINAPGIGIKILQKRLNEILQIIHKPKSVSHGFEIGKSIVTNAQKHIKKRFVFNIDLKDFFPTINFGRVRGLFKNFYKLNDEVSTLLAQICCYENCLPQGAPTSPIISNIICGKLDTRLRNFAYHNKFQYSRYADDITFSTSIKEFPENFETEFREIIKKEGFELNESKYRIQNKKIRQEVTGLSVNKKVNVKRDYIRNIRAILHCWKTKGIIIASYKYLKKYEKHRPIPTFLNSLKGRIEYIGMVRGKEDWIYLDFKNKFESLSKDISKLTVTEKRGEFIEEKDESIEEKRFKHEKDMIHEPENITEALMSFKKEGYALKRMVHTYQGDYYEYNFYELCDAAKKNFNDIKKILPYDLMANIYKNVLLLYQNEGEKIYEEKGKHPYDIDKYFAKKIDEFKKSIRFGYINEDQTNMEDFFNEIISNKYAQENKKFNELMNIELSPKIKTTQFYSDVGHLRIAIKKIFETIAKHSLSNQCNKVTVNVQNSRNRKILEIIHHDSTAMTIPNKNSFIGNDQQLKGDFGIIYKKLKYLCDWVIESEFENKGVFRIGLLGKKPFKRKLKNVTGFTHKLIFYV